MSVLQDGDVPGFHDFSRKVQIPYEIRTVESTLEYERLSGTISITVISGSSYRFSFAVCETPVSAIETLLRMIRGLKYSGLADGESNGI